MRIHQPDIMKCDLCNKTDDETTIYEEIPVLSYSYYSTEWGLTDDPPTVILKSLDLCEGCLRSVVTVEVSNKFHQPGYNFLRKKTKEPEELKIPKNKLMLC